MSFIQKERDAMTAQPLTTTLNRIRAHSPCEDGWSNLLKALGKTQADNEPVTYAFIARSNGIDDALWCCRAEPQHAKKWRLMAVAFVRQVQHLMKDPRNIDADVIARAAGEEAAGEAAFNAARAAAAGAARAGALVAALAAGGGAAGEAAWKVGGEAAFNAARERQREIFIEMVGE